MGKYQYMPANNFFYTSHKRRRRKALFLAFSLIIVGLPLFLAGMAFSSPSDSDTASRTYNHQGPRPLVATMNSEQYITLDIAIPPSAQDSWRLRDGKLELFLYGPTLAQQKQLDYNVLVRPEGEGVVVEVDINDLPPVYRVVREEEGYMVKWQEAGLAGKRIALDPGHGGHDPGALNRQLGLREKDITLAVALELRALLEAVGAEVFMTREEDTLVDTTVRPGQHIRNDLWMRRDLTNQYDPDLFISIHVNSWSTSSASGTETYYNSQSLNSSLSRQAATAIQRRMVAEFQRRDRGVKHKGDAVLQVDNFPAVLVEMLFISNPVEAQMMAANQFPGRAAAAIFAGIEDFFSGGEGR